MIVQKKLLARFQHPHEANQYIDLLEKDNIEYELTGLGTSQHSEGFSEAMDIWVNAKDFDQAVIAVKKNDYYVKCPNCGSAEVKDAVMENMGQTFFSIITKLFFGSKSFSYKKINYECEECNHIFSK